MQIPEHAPDFFLCKVFSFQISHIWKDVKPHPGLYAFIKQVVHLHQSPAFPLCSHELPHLVSCVGFIKGPDDSKQDAKCLRVQTEGSFIPFQAVQEPGQCGNPVLLI